MEDLVLKRKEKEGTNLITEKDSDLSVAPEQFETECILQLRRLLSPWTPSSERTMTLTLLDPPRRPQSALGRRPDHGEWRL